MILNPKLLVVDDERGIVDMIQSYFQTRYDILTAYSGQEALKKVACKPDLILLDINMPGMDGLTVCQKIREHIACPILFLTARIESSDKIIGFQAGADDYIVKPFDLDELGARIAAHLRREQRRQNNSAVRFFGELILDYSARTVTINNQNIPLSKREFEIVELLSLNAGQVFDRERIYERVWGLDGDGNSDTIMEHIRKIRAKFAAHTLHNYIETVWGCVSVERLKNMGLKKSFLLLSLSCLAVAFLLLGAVIFLCRGIENYYPLGGVEILSDGSIVPLPSPTASQQRILAILNIVQTLSCILFPVGGLIVSVFLFYYLKLKQPISCLQNGIMRIQNNDLDFSLPILSNDEMGQLCAAFEEMRSELLKSNRLLWQQAEERKRLNAAFSHDLRNPITVLKGSVKLLRQGIQDEQTIDRLESYTLRIEQYVEAMSSVQKLEQLSVKPKEIRLSVLQSELQETARLLALSKKVSVLVPSDGTVCIDHGLFLTVAENLIGNAARFAEKAISIQITLQNDSLVLKVEDDGAGYPLSLVQNGPNPFETTSSNSSHFGMGLYSSRILCEKHGGRLILGNQAGGGASATAIFHFV